MDVKTNSELQSAPQDKLYRDLIDEFRKNQPCDDTIKKCMHELNLEHQTDQFANMQKVLTALSFDVQSVDFKD